MSPHPSASAHGSSKTTGGAEQGGGIGLAQGVALYVCAILGAGVLVFPGQAASLAGPASLVAWVVSALIGLPLAFTFAALASRFPDAGGVATYVSRALGVTSGGVVGWWYFLAGSIGQSIVPLTAGYYVAAAAHVGQRWAPLFAVAVLAAAVAANLRGLRAGARLQIGLAAGVAAILMLVVVLGGARLRPENLTPFAPHGLVGVGQAVVVLYFAFAGWEAIAHLSGEFRDVRRTLPLATLCTVAIVTVLYLGVALAVVGTGSYGSPDRDRISLGIVIGDGLGVSAAVALAVAAVVICLGTTNAFVASVSRLGLALGRSGWAPTRMGRTGRHDVPVPAVLAVAGIGAAGLAVAAGFGLGTDDIVHVASVLVLATYLVGMLAAARQFRGRRRAVATVGLVLVLASVPFAGPYLLVPVGVAGAVVLAHRLGGRRPGDGRRAPRRRIRTEVPADPAGRREPTERSGQQ